MVASSPSLVQSLLMKKDGVVHAHFYVLPTCPPILQSCVKDMRPLKEIY